mmetsp:Transcript_30031/g.42867  ORF Transcript_30031/g.42867 Transcript_30031/m.42867 type:complete len:127 (-) Transcript_30031:1162-1542(-)
MPDKSSSSSSHSKSDHNASRIAANPRTHTITASDDNRDGAAQLKRSRSYGSRPVSSTAPSSSSSSSSSTPYSSSSSSSSASQPVRNQHLPLQRSNSSLAVLGNKKMKFASKLVREAAAELSRKVSK